MPSAGEHARGVLGELARVAAAVVADHHAARSRRSGTFASRYAREARACLADDRAVHPLRPGAEDAAQAGGAELERAVEALVELIADARGIAGVGA